VNGRLPCRMVATRRSGFLAVAASAAFPFSHSERLKKGDSVRALPVRVRPRDGRAYAVSVAERSYTQSGA
jgi:hypothetical protein